MFDGVDAHHDRALVAQQPQSHVFHALGVWDLHQTNQGLSKSPVRFKVSSCAYFHDVASREVDCDFGARGLARGGGEEETDVLVIDVLVIDGAETDGLWKHQKQR